MSELTLREPFRHDGQYPNYGRYSKGERDYEPDGLVHDQRSRVAMLGDLMRSTDPMDRVRAAVYINSLRVTVPAFVVVETPDSPNLYRWGRDVTAEERASIVARRSEWSAHVDEADAKAWCETLQRKADHQLAQHPWWGEGSKRIFGVEFWEHAQVDQLRQPGADPERHLASAFS